MVGKGKIGSIIFILLILMLFKVCYSEETVLFEIPHGTGPGELRTNPDNWTLLPGPFTTDEDENFYICDFYNDRIQVFDKSGKFIKSLVSKTGYNQFIHYENGKVYYSSITNGKRALEYYDLTGDSVCFVQYIKSTNPDYQGNPIQGSVIINDTFYILTSTEIKMLDVNNAKINYMTDAKLDTIIYQFSKNACLLDYHLSKYKALRICKNYIYLFNRGENINISESQSKDGVIIITRKANNNVRLISEKKNVYVSKKLNIYELTGILLKSSIGPLGYEHMEEMKFQMIEFK